MKKLVAVLLTISWLLLVAGFVYLIGAWCMLTWDYFHLIKPDDRGAMVGAFLLLCGITFWLPGLVYEEIYEP